MDIRIVRARCIHSDGRHNAFTGIDRFGDRTYVVFRNATSHVVGDGQIVVIRSADHEQWEEVHRQARAGIDLRDPKVVSFGGRLVVYTGGSVDQIPRPMAMISEDGETFGDLVECEGFSEGRWLWHMRAVGDALYVT